MTNAKTTDGKGQFAGQSWDEKAFSEVEGAPKLSRASVGNVYSGDIEGKGTLEYLLAYRADGTADYVGYERIVGTIGGRKGSFVLEHTGTFADGIARTKLRVVAGTGAGELHGLRGQGAFAAKHEKTVEYTFSYELG